MSKQKRPTTREVLVVSGEWPQAQSGRTAAVAANWFPISLDGYVREQGTFQMHGELRERHKSPKMGRCQDVVFDDSYTAGILPRRARLAEPQSPIFPITAPSQKCSAAIVGRPETAFSQMHWPASGQGRRRRARPWRPPWASGASDFDKGQRGGKWRICGVAARMRAVAGALASGRMDEAAAAEAGDRGSSMAAYHRACS